MKNLAILMAFCFMLATGCSKSDSTSETVCKLQKTTVTTNGATVTTQYDYDAGGKLVVVWEQNGKSDTSQSRRYFYADSLFSYSVGKDLNGNHDTTWYTYDNSKRIVETLKKNYNAGNLFTVVTRFVYNSTGLPVTSVATSTLDNVNFTIDSNLYDYLGSNVSGYTQYRKVGNNGWTTYRVKFGYDDQLNYMKITGEPQTSYPYWAVNNLNRYFNPDSTEAYMTYNYSNYTDSKYPQSYTVSFRPDQPGMVVSGTMSYRCE